LNKLLVQVLHHSPEVLGPDIKIANQPKVERQEGEEAYGGGLQHGDNVYGACAPLAYGIGSCHHVPHACTPAHHHSIIHSSMHLLLWWFMHLFDTYLAIDSGMHSPEQIIHPFGHAFIPLVVHALI